MELCPTCGRHIRTPRTAMEATARKGGRLWAWMVALLLLAVGAHLLVTPYGGSQLPATPAEAIELFTSPEFAKAGLVGFCFEGNNLQVEWDLRWEVLGDYRQREIRRFFGEVWKAAAGGVVEFRTCTNKMMLPEYPNIGS
jgi:hypothetical protein